MSAPTPAGTVIKRTDQPLATWPGGTTRTIYTYPPVENGDIRAAQLYVGTATIARNGPYSVFTDRTRIHMPMRGNGLHLHFEKPAETTLLHSFEQATFPGDRPLTVTLVDGMVEAFNLIFTANVVATVWLVTVDAGTEWILPGQPNTVRVLYLVEGNCSVKQDVDVQNDSTFVAGAEAQLANSDAHISDGGIAVRVCTSTSVSHLIVAVAKV